MPDERRVAEDITSYLDEPHNFVLPQPVDAHEAAEQIMALYEEGGRDGATFSLHFGNMQNQPLYSVSVWPERGTQPPDDELSVPLIQDYIEADSDVLKDLNDPRCGVGLWYDAGESVVYLDIVALLPNRLEAIELAKRYD